MTLPEGDASYAEADLGKIWDGSDDISTKESWNSLVGSMRGIYEVDDLSVVAFPKASVCLR